MSEEHTGPPEPSVPLPPSHPPAAAPQQKPQPRWLIPVISLLTGAAVVGAVWAITASAGGDGEGDPGTFDLRGTLTLKGSYGDFDSDCYGLDGYDDIGPGAAVTVYDASGDAVATGELVRPQYTSSACLYQVEVDDVPRGSKLYQVEVSHRGKVTLDAEEAEAGELAVSLGD